MYAHPKNLCAAHFEQLAHSFGNRREVCKLAGVSDRTMRRWMSRGQVPIAIVRLLWYASEEGRHAAAADIVQELLLLRLHRDALLRQIEAKAASAQPGRFGSLAANDWLMLEALSLQDLAKLHAEAVHADPQKDPTKNA